MDLESYWLHDSFTKGTYKIRPTEAGRKHVWTTTLICPAPSFIVGGYLDRYLECTTGAQKVHDRPGMRRGWALSKSWNTPWRGLVRGSGGPQTTFWVFPVLVNHVTCHSRRMNHVHNRDFCMTVSVRHFGGMLDVGRVKAKAAISRVRGGAGGSPSDVPLFFLMPVPSRQVGNTAIHRWW